MLKTIVRKTVKAAGCRAKSSITPRSPMFGVRFVPEGTVFAKEVFGKFRCIEQPGLRFFWPLITTLCEIPTVEQVISVAPQAGITEDNVRLTVSGVMYLRITDPIKAMYDVDDPINATTDLAIASMRANIGKMQLSEVFKARGELSATITKEVNNKSADFGVKCNNYFMHDVTMPSEVERAMQQVASADRIRTAAIIEADGLRTASITRAEGQAQALIIDATSKAKAKTLEADATAKALETVARAMQTQGATDAMVQDMTRKFIEAFAGLAQEGTTLIVPADVSNPATAIASMMKTFQTLNPASGKE